ncbi:MAG TPA: hypothetical protein VD969_06335 [Symbiobacteriaceae bacterium]|nr:hypothetical protein [Symbiobacteriaceae bacterium]
MKFHYDRYSIEVMPGLTGGFRVLVASGGRVLVYEDRPDEDQAVQTGAWLVAVLARTIQSQVLAHWGYASPGAAHGGERCG